MALWRRDHAGTPAGTGLVHHSDAGSQYTSFAFITHLIEAGIDASIGVVGDALDDALMESQIGPYKTELISPASPGTALPPWNSPPRNESTRLTTSASTARPATSHPTSTRPTTTLNTSTNRRLESTHRASPDPGTVQLTATASGATASYNYDPFGRQEPVTSAGKVIERSVYDGFDHVIESQKMDDAGALKSTKYTFDPLDRTASKTADGKTTDFEYLGLSGEVLDEKVAGELTKSYQYSPWGERLSQLKHNSDGTTEAGYYGYNSHTDVETLTDASGNTKATYGYTAYGSDDKSEFTGIDKPDTTDPTKDAYNPYRYNAKRWDAQSGTYDMGFRDYNPGLNRFTTRDMYNGALADMGLGADPFTGNRYAFGGGNPSTFVEYDGHRPIDCNEPGASCTMTSGGGWNVEDVRRSLAVSATTIASWQTP